VLIRNQVHAALSIR